MAKPKSKRGGKHARTEFSADGSSPELVSISKAKLATLEAMGEELAALKGQFGKKVWQLVEAFARGDCDGGIKALQSLSSGAPQAAAEAYVFPRKFPESFATDEWHKELFEGRRKLLPYDLCGPRNARVLGMSAGTGNC